MSQVIEIDPLKDFGLSMDHFYSLVKKYAGDLNANSYLQLQATALPLDLNVEYPWFSLGSMNTIADTRLDPSPVSDGLILRSGDKFSRQYQVFMRDLISLVEVKELDTQTREQISMLETRINNNTELREIKLRRRWELWRVEAETHLYKLEDAVTFEHWSQGQAITREIYELNESTVRDQTMLYALRVRIYKDSAHQAVVDAYAKATSPAGRSRYPVYEDKLYGEESAKFNAVYFAKLPDNDSNLFANRQNMFGLSTLGDITTTNSGAFDDSITKFSQANNTITTDWSTSGSGGWGPFRVRASASSHEMIKDDFSKTESLLVGCKSVQAIEMDPSMWYEPSIFRNKLIDENQAMFETYFGKSGSLLYYPSHLVIGRGFHVTFKSSQEWSYNYESDFSASGGGSARIFGIGFGGGANYSRKVREQKVERRGHDLIMDDGDNLRILGFIAVKNEAFEAKKEGDAQRLIDIRFNRAK